MQGTNWSLIGSATFSTSTAVEDGLLSVNGQLTSPTVTVMPGAVLGGDGTITGFVGNSGTIAPGNSVGTLKIVGDLQFNAGSVFAVEVNPGAADEIVVSGTATIDPSATVAVLALPGTYTVGMDYLILDAGTRTGTFGGLTDNSAFLDFALDQSIPNQVYLRITSVADFPDVAETPNQFATATALQNLGAGNPIFNALIALDAATARNAFDLLSGEIHPSLRSLFVDESRYVRDAVTNRVRQAFAALGPALPDGTAVAIYGASEDKPITAWGRVYGAFGNIDGDGNAAGLDRTSSGIFLGADREAFDVLAARHRRRLQPQRGRCRRAPLRRLDRHRPRRALWRRQLRRARPAPRRRLRMAWNRDDAPRRLPRLRARMRAPITTRRRRRYSARPATPTRPARRASSPSCSSAFVDVTTDGFTENDGAGGADGGEESTDIFLSTLGLHGSGDLILAGGKHLTADGTLGWRHAFGDVTPDTTFAFNAGAGLPFAIGGVPIARDAALVDLGLALQLGDAHAAPLQLFRRDRRRRPGPQPHRRPEHPALSLSGRERGSLAAAFFFTIS